jgi:hypothetical protein
VPNPLILLVSVLLFVLENAFLQAIAGRRWTFSILSDISFDISGALQNKMMHDFWNIRAGKARVIVDDVVGVKLAL